MTVFHTKKRGAIHTHASQQRFCRNVYSFCGVRIDPMLHSELPEGSEITCPKCAAAAKKVAEGTYHPRKNRVGL